MNATIGDEMYFSKAGDSQHSSSTGNDRQRGQRDIGGVAEVREPVFIDLALIRMCKDELDAVNLCIDLSRLSDEVLSSKLGIDKGHWSRMRKGRAHFPTRKRLDLMRLAGNWVPLQYEMEFSRVLERLKAEFMRPRGDGFSNWIAA